jgi:glycosyltransferase involved in cell wall biosynthesis
MEGPDRFVVAAFARCGHDYFARVLEKHGLLDFYALGTRRGTQGVSAEHTRLAPIFGLLNYAGGRVFSPYHGEAFRFRLFPFFDRWVKSQLRAGQHLLTSYAYANQSLRWVKEHGGSTFIDAQNAHPKEFWDLLSEEGKRWKSAYPPVSRFYNEQGRDTADHADYVFAPSTFVRRSFLRHGFEERRVFLYSLPVNLQLFHPSGAPRPPERPLTVLNTGALCLRKGTPYLLEAFRLILKQEPRAVLRLTRSVRNDVRDILHRFADLPIDWAPPLNTSIPEEREQFVRRYQTSDVFVLPSIEDGFAFVVAEALACGLPVVTTPNTGASDLIRNGENGEVVPIRDSQAIANAVLKWWSKVREAKSQPVLGHNQQQLDVEHFDKTVLAHLSSLGIRVQAGVGTVQHRASAQSHS